MQNNSPHNSILNIHDTKFKFGPPEYINEDVEDELCSLNIPRKEESNASQNTTMLKQHVSQKQVPNNFKNLMINTKDLSTA